MENFPSFKMLTTKDPRLQKIIDFYQQLTPETLNHLSEYYIEDAWFKDPFNVVQGIVAIEKIFAHMFLLLSAPKFVVLQAMNQLDQGFLVWEMYFEKSGLPYPMVIRGATQLQFSADGRVAIHRDYWDANEELFCHLPLVGGLFRTMRRQMSVSK